MARKRTAVWTLVGLATLGATGAAMWRSSDLGRASSDLGRQRVAAKREGVPIDWDDVRRLDPPVATEDNAALLYVRGFAELKAEGDLRGIAPHLLEDLTDGKAKPADVATLRIALAKEDRGLATVVEGTRRKGYSFARSWQDGPRLAFPEFSKARDAARTLVLRAVLASDPSAAASDLAAAARLGTQVGSEPVVIAPMVRSAIEATVERGIRVVARRGGIWPAAVRPVLLAFGPLPDLRRSLAFESASACGLPATLADMDLGTMSAMSLGGNDRSLPGALRLAKLRPVRDAFEARAIAYWRGVYAGLPADPLDWRGVDRALAAPIPAGPSGAVMQVAAPELSNLGGIVAGMEAERRLTREALALWSGAKPVPEADPFASGPLRLRRQGSAWTLYSVGPDGKDDGGKPRKGYADRRYDLVVTSS